MVNAGFLNRAEEIVKSQPKTFNGSLWKLNMGKGEPYNIAIISPHTLNLLVHFCTGSPATLCNKMYFEANDPEAQCDGCEQPGYQGKGTNNASFVKVMIGYVFDLVDKETTRNGRTYKENPLKIIEVTGGKKQANFENINDAVNGGYLTYSKEEPNIWRMKRLAEGGMAPPVILSKPELKKLQFNPNTLPDEILDRYMAIDRAKILGQLISGYGNLRKDELESMGFEFPTKVETLKDPTDALDE